MKYKAAFLLLLVWVTFPVIAQEKPDDRKPNPPQAKEGTPAPANEEKSKSTPIRVTPRDSADEEKSKSFKARGTPLGTVKGKTRPGEPKPDVIPDRLPPKPDRKIVVTDQRGRIIELADFHLGSAGVWEYDGLRIRGQEEKPLVKRPKPAPTARARVVDIQQRLHERLARKRVNTNGPEPKRALLTQDTVVKWDMIKEARLTRNKDDKTLYARVLTVDNKTIAGPVNVASDYLMGTRPNGRDFVIRLRNVTHIAFTGNPSEPKKKSVASVPKPHVNTVKWGDKSPKKLQGKPTSGE